MSLNVKGHNELQKVLLRKQQQLDNYELMSLDVGKDGNRNMAATSTQTVVLLPYG